VTPVALHHQVDGPEGAPVVLLGGSLGTTLELWDPQVPELAGRMRVVRFDARGHGRSPVPPAPYEIADLASDVLALMDALGIARASYVGLSIGAMIGMWLGAHAPERVERLALLCTSAHIPPASAWAERAAKVRQAGSTEVVADAVVERWLTPAFAAAHPDVRSSLRAMVASQPPEGYAASCGAVERMDLRRDIRAIRAPTLVIAGADDLATPPEHTRLIAGTIPNARLEVLAPAAHVASVERAEDVTRLLIEHLDPQEAT
jgi:3-oxoadipate enol-lactonase